MLHDILSKTQMPPRVTLEGQFVRLEPLSLDHISGLFNAATESRETYSFTLVPDTVPAMETYVQEALSAEATGAQLPYAIRWLRTGKLVGSSRFLDLDYWEWPPVWPPGRIVSKPMAIPDVAEIGSTWLARSAQRTSCNTESKLLMLRLAFEDWSVHRVTLKTDARNQRSRRGIERLGASFEGIRRAHVRATDGSIRDTAYYSILRAEWPEVASSLRNRLEVYRPPTERVEGLSDAG